MARGTTLRNIRIPDDLWAAAQSTAAEDGSDVSSAIRWFLTAWTNGEVVPWPVDSDIPRRDS